jgi:hypothetical protein
MPKILSVVALSLIAFWAVAFWVFHVSATIHIVLIIAGIILLIRLLYSKTLMQ